MKPRTILGPAYRRAWNAKPQASCQKLSRAPKNVVGRTRHRASNITQRRTNSAKWILNPQRRLRWEFIKYFLWFLGWYVMTMVLCCNVKGVQSLQILFWAKILNVRGSVGLVFSLELFSWHQFSGKCFFCVESLSTSVNKMSKLLYVTALNFFRLSLSVLPSKWWHLANQNGNIMHFVWILGLRRTRIFCIPV